MSPTRITPMDRVEVFENETILLIYPLRMYCWHHLWNKIFSNILKTNFSMSLAFQQSKDWETNGIKILNGYECPLVKAAFRKSFTIKGNILPPVYHIKSMTANLGLIEPDTGKRIILILVNSESGFLIKYQDLIQDIYTQIYIINQGSFNPKLHA